MKTRIFLTVTALFLIISVVGQKPTLELTFTAIDSATYVELDSIKVMNRTQGGDTTLFWPDIVLLLAYQVGITEITNDAGSLQVFQNYPNPVTYQTTISFYVPEKDKVTLIVTDMLGRVLINTERILHQGYHSYQFTPGNGSLFLFTVQWRESYSSIKILQTNSVSNNTCTLEYMGSEASSLKVKATEDIQSFFFSIGDELLYIGYTDTLQSGILDAPEESKTYTFQFATNIPCPETPTVTYEGQLYNTIQIFSQCWLKENLNVGEMILGSEDMTDNGIIERYCYNNVKDSCLKYGGLYQWDEMMQYTSLQGSQGICPSGWHLPTNEEWKVLEGAVDSQYGIGDPEWEGDLFRGFNAGTNLKTKSGWNSNGNGTDLFGFSGLPGGLRFFDGFSDVSYSVFLWASSEINYLDAWYRLILYYYPGVAQDSYSKELGFSVRCLKDY